MAFVLAIALGTYRIVASTSSSRIEAHVGLFRLLMKGIFDPYVLWPFDKKLISCLVTCVSTCKKTRLYGTQIFKCKLESPQPHLKVWNSIGTGQKETLCSAVQLNEVLDLCLGPSIKITIIYFFLEIKCIAVLIFLSKYIFFL